MRRPSDVFSVHEVDDIPFVNSFPRSLSENLSVNLCKVWSRSDVFFNFLIGKITWNVSMFLSYIFRRETSGSRNQHLRDQLPRVVAVLLLSSLCCRLHAQGPSSGPSSNSSSPISDPSEDFLTSETDVITPETEVLISAPNAISSSSLYVFTTGIPIRPVYIQAPPGLIVWLTIQCRGGAARMTLPQYVANFTMIQNSPSGEWVLPSLPLNDSWPVTGLGIKFNQNVSIVNDALGTLYYGKGADNDIAGRATMTVTLNWNATSAKDNTVIVFTKSKSIYVSTPTALTSLSTFQAAVAGVFILGILGLCCLGFLNSVGLTYLRRYNVLMARRTRDQQECDQTRVFNPLWMPCAPSRPGYFNIESTPNPMMLAQRRMEIKNLIFPRPTTLNFMERLTRVRHLKSRNYKWFGLQRPWATASPHQRVDWSSDDEFPVSVPVAARRGSQRKSPQANQLREVAMSKQQQGARPSVQRPPKYSPQRAGPSFNQQQPQPQPQPAVYTTQNPTYPPAPNYPQQAAQAQVATYNTQDQMHSGTPNYPQQAAQAQVATYNTQDQVYSGTPNYPQQAAQAQVATYNTQDQMYSGTPIYPQQGAQPLAMYSDSQPGTSQGPGAPGTSVSPETIHVGFAFIHHRFVEEDAQPLSKENSPRPGEFSPEGGHFERAQHREGKEPMGEDCSSEHCKPGVHQDRILHTMVPGVSMHRVRKLKCRTCQLAQANVIRSLESGSMRFEGGLSELQEDVFRHEGDVTFPRQMEMRGGRSEHSDRASERFGSPLSDLYEDVVESRSPTTSFPERIPDATYWTQPPLLPDGTIPFA